MDDVWAVGDASPTSAAAVDWVLHWDGRAWSQVATCSVSGLRTITGRSRSEVWAFGVRGGYARMGGGPCSGGRIPGIETTVRGSWMAANGEIWVVGDRFILRRDLAGSWAPVAGSPEGGASVWGSSPDDVWIVGSDNRVHRFDGNVWTKHEPMPPFSWGPTIVAGSSASDVWVAGSHGLFLHWDGRAWSAVSSGARSIDALAVAATGEAWALSDATGVLQRARP
jgi:hypothetical protein